MLDLRSALAKLPLSSIAFIVAILSLNVFADVPPDPGYTRVSSNLILESDADLSGYRFFLESPMMVEEIKIASGSPTTIEAAGRAGAMRFGRLIAIPSADIKVSDGTIESMIREKRFSNAKELLSHNFQATIPITEKPGWSDPVYRISITDSAIFAAPIAGGSPSGGRLSYSIWQFVWPVIIAGGLLAVTLAIAGVWLVRRSSKKA